MDDPNITMEEYIRLEEEKACRRGKVYNWETATYGKIWYDDDIHDLRSVETKLPAIVFNDELTSEEALSCEPTISPLNDNEIDFRISFDESDDEDYTNLAIGLCYHLKELHCSDQCLIEDEDYRQEIVVSLYIGFGYTFEVTSIAKAEDNNLSVCSWDNAAYYWAQQQKSLNHD
nr:hypothetical protein [Tanacetum cinerariifolium]